ncbi:MAG: cobalamin-dependent protein [Candidatus Bathyarchaeota archaeon]|nr:cobalamin-dependent protein [Candidatus Bathyarchaeota archaeon]
MINDFENSIINLDIEKAIQYCKELIESGQAEPIDILKTISRALDVVGQKYEEKEYFLSELIMAGEIVNELLKIIDPLYKRDESTRVATIVLASVKGDLHDIGKNILGMLLRSSNFNVIDLGTDVDSNEIVKAVKENEADFVGLSALLTTTIHEFGHIVEDFDKAGIRNKVKIIVGGSAVNEDVAGKYHVDGWGKTAVEGVRICRQWAKQGGD